MKNFTTRRIFLQKLAFITSALFLLTSVSQLQAFNFKESPFSGYHPYAEENTDSCTFDAIVSNNVLLAIECPGGLLSENSVAVVYSTTELWSPSGNQAVEQALNAAFGAGNWDAYDYNSADASVLFGGTYGYVYLEGGDNTANAFNSFIATNRTLIENWVNDGGHLFMNSAPNEGGDIDLGFGGFTLLFNIGVTGNLQGLVEDPGHPAFNGPLTPANGNFSGGYFAHAILVPAGVGYTVLITGENEGNIVVEYPYGSGIVVFGGLTTPNFHSPAPNTYNWLSNLHTYLNQPGMSKITVEADNSMCSYTHNGTGWDATVTGTVDTVEYVLTGATTGSGTSLDGVEFNLGVTTVTWTATDGDSNTDVCSFKVIVEDNEDPETTCVGNQTVTVGPVCNYTHSGTAWDAIADDNCSVATLEYELTGATTGSGTSLDGVEFNLGVTTVTWTATDGSSNTGVCSFTVTVEDNEAPEITCVGNQTPAPAVDVCTYTHSGTAWDAITSDNCSLDTVEYMLTGVTTGSGTSLDGVEFNFGITTVTWTATDSSDNTNECSFKVYVYSLDCIPHKLIKISPDTTAEIIKIIIPSEVVTNSVILKDDNGTDMGISFVNGEMDMSSLSEGIYFLTVDTDKGVISQTVVKM